MAEVKDGKGGKLFNQVLNFLHGGYVDHVFFSNLSGKKQTQANSAIFALNSELHHSTCLTISAVGTRITPSGGRCRHSCHGRICWHQSGCSWREPAAWVKAPGFVLKIANPKSMSIFLGGGQTEKIITVACGCIGWSPPSLQAIESLDPIKVWALQGSGSNQKWHGISQSLATAMLRNHHNIPIGPQ